MKRGVIALLCLSTGLMAQYCIQVAEFEMADTRSESVKTQMEQILADIPYPSTQLLAGKVLLFSGSFATGQMADRLLPLTQKRYPGARVRSCSQAQPYVKSEALQANSRPQVMPTAYETSVAEGGYYCLQLQRMPLSLSKTASGKEAVARILSEVPQSGSRVEGSELALYSGRFESEAAATAVVRLLKQRYPEIRLSRCSDAPVNKPQPVAEPVVTVTQVQPEPLVEPANISQSEQPDNAIEELETQGYIPEALIASSKAADKTLPSRGDIRHALDIQREEEFNGLYVRSNTGWDTLNSEIAYDIRLEWDLFDQGYYASKKRSEIDRLENEVTFYKMLKNVQSLRREEALRHIEFYTNALISHETINRLKLQERFLMQAKQKFEARVLTQYEYDMIVLDIQKDKENLMLYHSLTLLKIPPALWELLNHIESVRLREPEQLMQKQKHSSVEIALADAMGAQKPLQQQWSDKLRLNFYVGQRKMYVAQDQTIVGVEAKIPLTSYERTDELERLQTTILKTQAALQLKKSSEELRRAIARFNFSQQRLKTRQHELGRLKAHLEAIIAINESGYAGYLGGSSVDEQKLLLGFFEKRLDVQRERLAIYKELINLLYLTQGEEISDLLEYALPYSGDRQAGRTAR